MRYSPSPQLLLVLTALFWGGHWVVARAVHLEASPVGLSFWRWVTATLVLAPFALKPFLADRAKLRAQWRPLALASITGTGLYNAVGYVGIQYTAATNALLIQSVTPALIPLFAFILVRERIGPAAVAGFAVSCAGVLAIASQLKLSALLVLELNPGDLWLFLNVSLWALYTVCLRWKPQDLHPLSFLLAVMAMGVLQLLPFYAYDLANGARLSFGAPGAGRPLPRNLSLGARLHHVEPRGGRGRRGAGRAVHLPRAGIRHRAGLRVSRRTAAPASPRRSGADLCRDLDLLPGPVRASHRQRNRPTTMGWLRDWKRRRVVGNIRSTLRCSRVVGALPFLRGFERHTATPRGHGSPSLAEKQLTLPAGGALDDEDRLSIAMQACLPILELGLDWYEAGSASSSTPAISASGKGNRRGRRPARMGRCTCR